MTYKSNFAMITSPGLIRGVASVIEQLREIQSPQEWDRLISNAPSDPVSARRLTLWHRKHWSGKPPKNKRPDQNGNNEGPDAA